MRLALSLAFPSRYADSASRERRADSIPCAGRHPRPRRDPQAAQAPQHRRRCVSPPSRSLSNRLGGVRASFVRSRAEAISSLQLRASTATTACCSSSSSPPRRSTSARSTRAGSQASTRSSPSSSCRPRRASSCARMQEASDSPTMSSTVRRALLPLSPAFSTCDERERVLTMRPLARSVHHRLPLRLGHQGAQRPRVRRPLSVSPHLDSELELTLLFCARNRYVSHLHEHFEHPPTINERGFYNVRPPPSRSPEPRTAAHGPLTTSSLLSSRAGPARPN